MYVYSFHWISINSILNEFLLDKDKLLTDETTVDPEKFSCFIACTLKESGVVSL